MTTIDLMPRATWIVRWLTMTFDNTEDLCEAVTEAAHNAVRSYGREQFAAMLVTNEDRGLFVMDVGYAVVDAIGDLLAPALESVPAPFELMIEDVLDLQSSETAWQLGEHYLPESADDVEWDES